MHEEVKFIRRVNSDGSYTSVCSLCFLTAADRVELAKLADEEAGHICHCSIWDRSVACLETNWWP